MSFPLRSRHSGQLGSLSFMIPQHFMDPCFHSVSSKRVGSMAIRVATVSWPWRREQNRLDKDFFHKKISVSLNFSYLMLEDCKYAYVS